MTIRKNFFVSYARADNPLPNRLLALSHPRLAIMNGFRLRRLDRHHDPRRHRLA